MGKGKKKGGGKKRQAAQELAQEEAREELLALEAIFGEDLAVREEGRGPLGFTLRVVPHPGEAAANHVSLTLAVSYPDDYPGEELGLRLTDAVGLREGEVRALSKALHTAAEGYAEEGEVCCFQLVTLAQEFLQQHNRPPEEEEGEGGPPAPQSLWHEMLQRDLAAAADARAETSMRVPPAVMGDTFFDSLDGGGLFSDAADLPVPHGGGGAGTPAVPVVEVRASGSKAPRPPKPLGPAAKAAAAAAPAAAAAAPAAEAGVANAAAGDGQLAQPAAAEVAAAAAAEASGAAGMQRHSSSGATDDDATPTPPSGGSLAAASGRGQHSRTWGGGSSMRGGSMLRTIRGVLPRPLRRYLDGAGGAGGTAEEGSEAGDAGGLPLGEEDRQLIRQELFLGHLLALAASSGAVPPHALPSIAAHLQGAGLIPKWLAFTLTQQPALFDRAFQRCFARELEGAAAAAEGGSGDDATGDDPMAWAVQRFWRRRAAPMLHSRSLSHLRSRSGALLGPGGDAGLPSSRYEADFAEVRQLGRGGYGVVVAAINRLDGRTYAVKKIPLDAHSAGAYARIMREVTTLSRLQHTNVVRYFQAWVEAAVAGRGGGAAGDDDSLDEWGSSSLAATLTPRSPLDGPAGLSGPTGSRAAGGGSGWGDAAAPPLAPVAEVSREGQASTPSKGTRYAAASEGDSSRSGASSGSDGASASSGEASEPSASFGNLAVAGANALLAAPGPERPPSSATAGFVSAWGSSAGEASESAAGESATTATATTTTGGEFTFDRSRPAGGGGSGWAGASGTTYGPGGASGTQPSGARGGGARGVQQTLFVSMEYCPRTLRDVLDSGELDDAGRWSILRQILAGLAHIHAQGIIHRDLKPANTFIDGHGAVKLGDFGLAKYNTADGGEGGDPLASPAVGGDSRHGTVAGGASALFSDTTGLVGTSYYISPEIREGWASYDARVDLFSLGVMAFEIWHPFATGMERAVLLRDLREHGVMPAPFEAAQPVVCRLIRWLLAPNPAERPTAAEVLRSELLPPQVVDEQLTDLLRSLPDAPDLHAKVLEAVWALPGPGAAPGAAAAAALEAPGAPVAVHMAAREHVLGALRAAFARHGAVAMCSQEVGLAGGDDPPGAVQLLTPAGTKLALRWELRAPFVRWFMQQLAGGGGGAGAQAATLLLDGLRRYEVAAVQRRAAGQGLPRAFLQADLDFIAPGDRTPVEQLLTDAEVITATHEALSELPECGELEVRLGHRALFELALGYVGASREARGSVIQLLSTAAGASPLHSTARAKRWPAIKAGLEGIGLSAEAIARCRQLVLQAAGEAEAAIFRLRTLLAHVVAGRGAGGQRAPGRPSSAAALGCLDDLQALLQHLTAWGVPPGQLLVDPLLAPHSDGFSGALFQCHLVQGSTGTTAVVAAGGRYDALLKATWARQSALSGVLAAPMPPLHACGVTLNVDRLVTVAAASSRWRQPSNGPTVAGLPRLSQADVLVCSRGGGGLLRERMALARTLWDAGIAAELLPQASPSLTAQFEYAQGRAIPWLVIIQASTFGAADTVRVKAMGARLEEDVPASDLPAYLLASLHPHGAPPPPAAAGRTPGGGGGGRAGDDSEEEGEEPSAHGGRERQRRGGRR